MQNNSPRLRTSNHAETAIFRYDFVLKKKVEKLGFKSLRYMDLSFKTKASTPPDENPHTPG